MNGHIIKRGLQERRNQAQELKDKGNSEFKAGNFDEAVNHFTSAVTLCPMCCEKERSIMYSNRGAALYRLVKLIFQNSHIVTYYLASSIHDVAVFSFGG